MTEAPGVAELEAALGALVPPEVAVAVWSPALAGDVLGSRELASIERAVPKRREEFARGRACAREALRRAGHEAAGLVEIPVGPSREPMWPDGFTGSITHCDGVVAAVAAPLGAVRGIGLDAEPDRPLPPEVASQVITPDELAAGADPGDHVVRFSGKESIHKVVFPLTGVWLDFLDVALELEDGAFRGRPAGASARVTIPEVARMRGRYARLKGVVVTVAWL